MQNDSLKWCQNYSVLQGHRCFGSVWPSDVLHLMQLISLVHDLTLLSGVKVSLTIFPPSKVPIWLPSTIAVSQISFLVRVAWVCPVLTPILQKMVR